jgi:myo-inositol-1(or 4)-monophosphatase
MGLINHANRDVDIEIMIRKVGDLAIEMSSTMMIEVKSVGDMVTNVDREVERLLVEYLNEKFPDDGIIGEEGNQKSSVSGRFWAIDPIDGTADFIHGLPGWSVSVALLDGEGYLAGYVYVPTLSKFYRAARGEGATCNGIALRIREGSFLSNEFIAMNAGTHLKLNQSLETRICNAPSAFGPCLVASGKVLGSVSLPAYIWDIAAGYAIASEAGAHFEYLDGSSFSLSKLQNRERMPSALLCGSRAFITYAHERIDLRGA